MLKLRALIFLLPIVTSCHSKVIKHQLFQQDNDEIFCEYQEPAAGVGYKCNLNIQNPIGRNDFTSVGGDHVDGFTNADVDLVYVVYQNTRNFPSIICQQFPNVRDIIIGMSEIRIIDASSFTGCGRMEFLAVSSNKIARLLNGTFANNPELEVFIFDDNNLMEIDNGIFTGTKVNYVDLSYNNLKEYDPNWFNGIEENLNVLVLNFNEFTSFPAFSFELLTNLKELDISMNPLRSVYQNLFSGLFSLTRVYMSGIGLTNVIPNWFEPLTSIQHIILSYNQIRDIDDNSFDNLSTLQTVDLAQNDLTFIKASAFGSSINNIRSLALRDNRISALDEEFISNSNSLLWLILNGNECANRNFYNVQEERDQVTEELQQCFTNFIGSISCQFFSMSPFPYECLLFVTNPVGRNFDEIGGEHVGSMTDNDVIVVEALYQNTRNFPTAICRQFPNVEHIWMEENQIEIVAADSFNDCKQILRIILAFNKITVIPDFLFSKNPTLQIFIGFANEIKEIGLHAFDGSALRIIELDNNKIEEFVPETFEVVADTLTVLFLSTNRLISLPSAAFNRLSRLEVLDISHNPLGDIPGNAFRFLTRLEHLQMMSCDIRSLNVEWFQSLYNLVELRLENNMISTIPTNAFINIQRLTTFSISANSIRNIHGNSFGNLSNLNFFLSAGNKIRAFDRQIFDQAHNLRWLYMEDNNCLSRNINNVSIDRDSVRSELAECFRMFDGFLNCEYNEIFTYSCRMTIQNVQGRDDFTEIPGDHIENRGNADVRIVDAEMQDTVIIPSIICRQFPNLHDLFIKRSFIQFISEEMIEDCVNLELLNLDQNEIKMLPDFIFINNPFLHTLELYRNEISSIQPSAFANIQLEMIDLEFNLLTEIDGRWFAAMGESLVYLYLSYNKIRHVPENAFENLQNLVLLDIGVNAGIQLPSRVFQLIPNLNILLLDECEIMEIDPLWFSGHPSLMQIFIYENSISELPAGAFNNIAHLNLVDIAMNDIPLIHADSFGSSLSTIRYFYSDENPIRSIDPQFFDQAQQLNYLFLSDNECIDQNFYNIMAERESIRDHLQDCFSNFENREEISCIYGSYPNNEFICVMTINNPSGHDNYDEIFGELEGINSDVREVQAFYQNTRIIPRIICEQFTSLKVLSIISSGIQRLTQDAFSSCVNLERVVLDYNNISSISAETFRNNRNLREIDAMSNRIHTIEASAFSGTALILLYLGSNRLSRINSDMLHGIEETLLDLYLYSNGIQQIPEDLFEGLENLEVLDIGLNAGINLPSNIFRPLRNILFLYIDGTELDSLNPAWFETLENLEHLHLPRNNIRSLPENIFANLSSLTDLLINDNSIRSINSNIFGQNIQTINYINAINSQINAIDEQFIDEATNLDILYLYDNKCTSGNFYNVIQDREAIKIRLANCFDNFRGSVECHFARNANQEYFCVMLISNMAGHDQFTDIPGDHESNLGNSDVKAVQSQYQNTRNIPAAICRQFNNIEEIFIEDSMVEQITVRNCQNLQRLILGYNEITSIEAGTFAGNPKLVFLDLHSNKILRIAHDAFDGSSLQALNIGMNRLGTFNSAWITSISASLRDLRLYDSQIAEIPEAALENLSSLEYLDIGINYNINIPPNAFNSLTNLQSLFIDSCQIRNLNPQWFSSLKVLSDLHLHSNNLRSLPENSFNNLNMTYLSIRDNRVTSISSNSFGDSLRTLESLYATNNRINAIDKNFFDQAISLHQLYLLGNICVNQNFREVPENRWIVYEQLSECFGNF